MLFMHVGHVSPVYCMYVPCRSSDGVDALQGLCLFIILFLVLRKGLLVGYG